MNLPATVPPLEVATPGVQVVPLASGRWRVTSRSGRLLGHLEAVSSDGGDEGFRAMRFSVRERGFRMLGEYRTATDAADALHYG
jgi:hypothetical protein